MVNAKAWSSCERRKKMRFYLPGICGYGLSFQLDGFRIVFATLAVLAWTMALVASVEYMKHDKHPGRYYFFTVVTLFATLGVFLSADFFNLFYNLYCKTISVLKRSTIFIGSLIHIF